MSPELRAGDRLGPFRAESERGRGGMGVVLRARDERLGRAVAPHALRRGPGHPGLHGARADGDAQEPRSERPIIDWLAATPCRVGLARTGVWVAAYESGALFEGDLAHGPFQPALALANGRVARLAIAPDGGRAITADAGGRVVVWSLEGGDELASLALASDDWLVDLSYLPDGTGFVGATGGGRVIVFEVR